MQVKYVVAIALALILGVVIGYLPPALGPKPVTTVTQVLTQFNTVTSTVTTTVPMTIPVTITSGVTMFTTVTTTTQSLTTIMLHTTLPTTVITTVTVSWPRTVVDALGREVRFNEPPKRVVSTTPSITEYLFALGLGNRVVGVDRYSNWPPDVLKLVNQSKIAVVGGPWSLDMEKIVSLKPDLVLMCRGINPQETQFAPKLEEMGIKTLFLVCNAAKNQYDIFMDIRMLGRVFGVEQSAEVVVEGIQRKIDEVVGKLINVTKKPRVLQLAGPPSWGLWSAGGDTFIGWLIKTAGGINIASQYSGWPQLNYEYILSQNPEIIIVTVMGMDPKRVIEEISHTPLANTTAWKTGRVYVLTGEADDIISRPGPRIADALTMIAQIIHPEVFGEVQRNDVVKMSFVETQLSTLAIPIKTVGVEVAEV
uniref:ABC transporter substrate-binding protein n=1 Tax=Ignisphaera aggregans TaxID=334771 RepID=A0A7J2U4J1_9CREN